MAGAKPAISINIDFASNLTASMFLEDRHNCIYTLGVYRDRIILVPSVHRLGRYNTIGSMRRTPPVPQSDVLIALLDGAGKLDPGFENNGILKANTRRNFLVPVKTA